MSFDLKKLYSLLPALYRIRDTELGIRLLTAAEKADIEAAGESLDEHAYGPIRALLSIIAEQVAALEENLDQLYDDQFIETCAEWIVSYIGELVGTRGLIEIPGVSFSQRAEVANTIAYRRRKGTASVIEQLARDVTNWSANVVEYFQYLATTQYMNHLRPQNLSIAGLRNWERLEYHKTPFDKMAHTVDVRRIESNRGKYNIQNIGVFLWRLNSYSLTKAPAYRVLDDPEGRLYRFDPLGKDIPLYNLPITEEKITHLAEPINVPMPISRRLLLNRLNAYYGQDKSILIYVDNGEVSSDLISVCDLRNIYDDTDNFIGWANLPKDKIAIDPVLGRIAFPSNAPPPTSVHVSFYYGFSADMGGGEYDRANTFTEGGDSLIEISAGSGSIQTALDQLAVDGGVVEIIDNENYVEDLIIKVAAGKTIELRSANQQRPVIVISGEMIIEVEENGKVILNGLVFSGGQLRVPLINNAGGNNKLESLRVLHCTFVPDESLPKIIVEAPNTIINIEKSILGGMRVFDGAKVSILDSIIDASDESKVAYAGLLEEEAGGTLQLQNCTVIGKVYTILMELASNTIFLADSTQSDFWPAPIVAQRLQQGCVRFSYFPPGSKLPRPYRCQPASLDIAARVRPLFTAMTYGEPAYGQLSQYCATEITRGADDEAEMGAFHHLFQAQRISNLRTRLDEYLRFGLEAGIFFAS